VKQKLKDNNIVIQKSELLKLTRLAVQINRRAKEMVNEIVKICDENSELSSCPNSHNENEFYH